MTDGSFKQAENQTDTLVVPVGTQPDLLRVHAADPQRFPYLLESAAGGTEQGRFDILFAFPGDTLTLHGDGSLSGPCADVVTGFLHGLDKWFVGESLLAETPPADLPFSGGWFLYLGYELAAEVEPTLNLPIDENVPVAFATRIQVAVIRNRDSGETFVVGEAGCDELVGQVVAALSEVTALADDPSVAPGEVEEEDPQQFLKAVLRAKEYIAAGDVFQANLSRQWAGQASPGMQPWHYYQRLRAANPAPFAGLAVRGDFAVVSSSPERLISCDGEHVETRPIAGTTPRRNGSVLSGDDLEAFLGNPKERAEHVMLIDLERNDLGRICEGGSVVVDEFMVVESYSHVHHIVSNVRGKLRSDVTPGAMIRAVFPGGTITGCPKVRCMEIIAELEGRPRGAYTGSMGYLNRNGSADLSILIRTMTLQEGRLTLAAGSGIVADSKPESELEETRAKAKGLLMSLQEPAESSGG